MTTGWAVVLWIATVSPSGWTQSVSQDSFPITPRQVAQTLADRGMQVTDEQVSLVARVVANDSHPVLDVLSIVPQLGNHNAADHDPASTWVKLACRLPSTCLPFYAVVSRPQDAVQSSAKILSSSSSALGAAILKPNVGIAMRAGTHATLVMNDDRSHIQVAVISLENGIAGHRIRVSSPDHKQVYFGEVVSASLLKGSY